MTDKQIVGIIVVVGVVLLIMNSPQFDFPDGVYSVFGDPESQYKEEYNTLWADSTDGQYVGGQTYPDFEYNTNLESNTDQIIFNNGAGFGGGSSVTFKKQDLYGKEIAIVFTGYILRQDSTGNTYSGSCGFMGVSLECVTGGQDGYNLQFNCPSLNIEAKPRTFEQGVYDVFSNGALANTMTVPKPFYPVFSCGVTSQPNKVILNGVVEYIGYRTPSNCEISSQEVPVQENFGSAFSIKDLSFIPSKFCSATRPFTVRYVDREETISPDPVKSLNKGETLTPPSTAQHITANYFTYFVEGVTPPCNPVNGKIVKENGVWVCRNYVEPITVIVQCQTDNDCPKPLQNNCPNYFTGCKSNLCTYDDSILNSVQCKNEVVTIVKEKEIVQVRDIIISPSNNQFIFSGNYPSTSFSFGSETFRANFDYSCSIPSDANYYFPSPTEDCYSTTATFLGKSHSFKDKQELPFSDNMKATFYNNGKVNGRDDNDQSREKESLGGYFLFTISNPLSLDIDVGMEVVKDTQKNVNITLTNNLPPSTGLLKVTQIDKTTSARAEKKIDVTLASGVSEVPYNLITSSYGIQRLEIQVFYKITVNGQEHLMPSETEILHYNIVDKLSNPLGEFTFTEDIGVEPIVVLPSKETGWGSIFGISTGVLLVFLVIGWMLFKK